MNHVLIIVNTYIQIASFISAESLTKSRAAANIANKEFSHHLVTTVIWWRYHSAVEDITEFLKDFQGSVVTAPLQNVTSYEYDICAIYKAVKYMQVVFFANTADDFVRFLEIINRLVVIPFRVILIFSKSITNPELGVATKSAWDNNVGDIIILSTDVDDKFNIKLSTYIPYGNGKCGNYTPLTLPATTEHMFPRKFSNFHQCPMKVILHQYKPYIDVTTDGESILLEGIDKNVFLHLLEKLNATWDLEIISPARKTNWPKEFLNRRGDLMLPSSSLSLTRYSVMQTGPIYLINEIVWCGPYQRPIYAWLKFLIPFFNNVTAYIISTFAIFTLAMKFIRKIGLNESERKSHLLFQSFAIFLGQEVRFETKCRLVNSLFVLWIWFSIIMRTVFQGDLLTGLHKIMLEPPLVTLEESLKVVDGYGGASVFQDFLENLPALNKYKVIDIPDYPNLLNQIENGKRFLLMIHKTFTKRKGRQLQILKDLVGIRHLCIFIRPGWPAAPEVQSVIYKLIQSGLVIYDKDIIINPRNNSDWKHSPPDLNACFYNLMAMYSICFMVFCTEILFRKYDLKDKIKFKK